MLCCKLKWKLRTAVILFSALDAGATKFPFYFRRGARRAG